MATAKVPDSLFLLRFALLNTAYYTPEQILSVFGPSLKAAGYTIYQTPAVKAYIAKFRTKKEGPFPDDSAKSVYETMYVMGPDGKEISMAKDLTNDKMGSRPILESRKPAVTAISWNIGMAPKATKQNLIDLIWQIRREKLYDSAHYTGLAWPALADRWGPSRVKHAPYPDKPALPASLLPPAPIVPEVKPKPAPIVLDPIIVTPKPAPKPDPKPAPKPDPKPDPKPTPTPVVEASIFGNWKLWAGFGVFGTLYALFADDKKR